jgi:hypothetical protein
MVKMLMTMHRIALCTPCTALVNCDHHFAYALDHTEPKMKVQAEREVRWTIEGPQAPSCENANIVGIKASPSASNHHSLSLFYSVLFLIMILGCAIGYRS